MIAIVSTLAVFLMLGASSFQRKTHAAKCINNLRQLGTGLLGYALENGNRLPAVNPIWDYAIANMNGAGAVYTPLLACPGDKVQRIGAKPTEKRSYSLNPTLCNLNDAYKNEGMWGSNPPPANTGIRLSALPKPSRTVLLLERHEGLNIYNSGNFLAAASIYNAHKGSMNIVYCDGHLEQISTGVDIAVFQKNYLSRGQ